MLQAVDLYLIEGSQKTAELSSGETFAGEPDHVGLGKIYQPNALVFAERHLPVGQFPEPLGVLVGNRGWSVAVHGVLCTDKA